MCVVADVNVPRLHSVKDAQTSMHKVDWHVTTLIYHVTKDHGAWDRDVGTWDRE